MVGRFITLANFASHWSTMTTTHIASRTIIATPRAIFRALIDPESMPCWRAPAGMALHVLAFDPHIGGRYRIALTYDDPASASVKSTTDSDIVNGSFVELVADERIIEDVTFESDDPAFSGTMRITTSLAPVAGGTKVTITAENVPSGISEEDHRAGMNSTLKNLANFIE
jgi:uncharacterized protein YndB with AHSA1/START domain